jgi:hypothetical protein
MGKRRWESFTDLSRQNTGRHFLDSGDHYGRNYERPKPTSLFSIEAGKYRPNEIGATIHTGPWLDSKLQIIGDYDRMLDACNRLERYSVEEQAEALARKLSRSTGETWKSSGADNVYNHENDFDQVFVFAVVSTKDEWYYDDDAIVLIQTHNGCDVRGGYSDTVCAKFDGGDASECGFLDWCMGFYSEACDRYSVGHTSNPAYHLSEDSKRVTYNKRTGIVTAWLKTGEKLKLYPEVR